MSKSKSHPCTHPAKARRTKCVQNAFDAKQGDVIEYCHRCLTVISTVSHGPRIEDELPLEVAALEPIPEV